MRGQKQQLPQARRTRSQQLPKKQVQVLAKKLLRRMRRRAWQQQRQQLREPPLLLMHCWLTRAPSLQRWGPLCQPHSPLAQRHAHQS